MRFFFNGNGNGFEVHIQVNWVTVVAMLKAVLAMLVVVSALLAALAHLGS